MFRHPVADFVLLPLAAIAVLGHDIVWPTLCTIGRRIAGWRPLLPLRQAVGRLPVLPALVLFLVPELCSRAGTLASAWLLLNGDWWRALAVYVGAKLLAGGTALWIYTACEPVLLRMRLFAAMHGAIGAFRVAAAARMPRGARPGRWAVLCDRIRAHRTVRAMTASVDRHARLP